MKHCKYTLNLKLSICRMLISQACILEAHDYRLTNNYFQKGKKNKIGKNLITSKFKYNTLKSYI